MLAAPLQRAQAAGFPIGVACFASRQGRVKHAPRSGRSPLTERKTGKENDYGPSSISCHWALRKALCDVYMGFCEIDIFGR